MIREQHRRAEYLYVQSALTLSWEAGEIIAGFVVGDDVSVHIYLHL